MFSNEYITLIELVHHIHTLQYLSLVFLLLSLDIFLVQCPRAVCRATHRHMSVTTWDAPVSRRSTVVPLGWLSPDSVHTNTAGDLPSRERRRTTRLAAWTTVAADGGRISRNFRLFADPGRAPPADHSDPLPPMMPTATATRVQDVSVRPDRRTGPGWGPVSRHCPVGTEQGNKKAGGAQGRRAGRKNRPTLWMTVDGSAKANCDDHDEKSARRPKPHHQLLNYFFTTIHIPNAATPVSHGTSSGTNRSSLGNHFEF